MHTKLKFIKRVIYKMKRSYGLPIQYIQVTNHDTDTSTGVKSTTYSKVSIKRAIVLRAREFRSFVYDLAYISANKDFTTGAFFDPEDRKIIIDAIDVPTTFEPNPDDFIIFQNRRYNVSGVYSFEDNYAWMFDARAVRGEPVIRIESVSSTLTLTQSTDSETVDKLIRSPSSLLTLTQTLVEVP